MKKEMTFDEIKKLALSYEGAYLDCPFRDSGWEVIRNQWNQKVFVWMFYYDGEACINVKVRPEERMFLRDVYSGILPAYHLNKEHWSMVKLDGSVPNTVISQMIEESFYLVTDSPSKRIYEAVKRIPKGKVATYGQVAKMAGNPRMSRAVGNALHKNPDSSTIPCHRVVNSKGELAGSFAFGGEEEQANRLVKEGVQVNKNRVDLKQFGIKEEEIPPQKKNK